MAGDRYYGNVVLLLHGDGADDGTIFTDDGPLGLSPDLVNPTIVTDTDELKFGSASIKNVGGAGYFYYDGRAEFQIGTREFTYEMWLRMETDLSGGAADHIFTGFQQTGSNRRWSLEIGETTGIATWFNPSNSGLASTTDFRDLTWHFLSISRRASGANSNVYLHVDGILEDSITETPTTDMVGAGVGERFEVGRDGSVVASSFDGWLDDFRWTMDVGRYDSSSYTPPTAPFPNKSAAGGTAGKKTIAIIVA
jgi:hypothetical protein